MLKELAQWQCDSCGQVIEKPSDGKVCFYVHPGGFESDFSILHNGRCAEMADNKSKKLADKGIHISILDLQDFIESDGLARLLSLIDGGLSKQPKIRQEDIPQFINFIRRLHLPFFEESRKYLSNPDQELAYELIKQSEDTPYLKENLLDILKRYQDK